MQKQLTPDTIEDLIDRVAADPKQATYAKSALRKLVVAKEPEQPFEARPRRRVAEIDDDLFDNMPI